MRLMLKLALLLTVTLGGLDGSAHAAGGIAPGDGGVKPIGGGPVVVLTLEGVVDPVMARYVERGYSEANTLRASAVVLSINTPGGLMTSMREIIQAILNAPIPTIGYVTPKGGLAGSAGAFIMMACHLTAMAPGTTMGAAHPVSGKGEEIPKTLDKKITNDAAALMRSLAAQRGRNAVWAEETVTKSKSSSEQEALTKKAIELVAGDLEELLDKFNGRTVSWTASGSGKLERRTLDVAAKRVIEIPMNWRERLFHMLAHPELAYILLSLGTMGLIFELQSSGLGLAGFFGGVCLILALISLSIIPFNVGGLLLMAIGVGLFFADLKLQTHGGLSLLGVICLFFGSTMLFSPIEPFFRVSRPLIYSTVGCTAAFFGALVYLGLKAQASPAATGPASLAGAPGVAVSALDPDGIVHVKGEDWSATAEARVRKGDPVIVKSVKGLTLLVEGTSEGAPRAKRPATRRRS